MALKTLHVDLPNAHAVVIFRRLFQNERPLLRRGPNAMQQLVLVDPNIEIHLALSDPLMDRHKARSVRSMRRRLFLQAFRHALSCRKPQLGRDALSCLANLICLEREIANGPKLVKSDLARAVRLQGPIVTELG